jgi:hypothetical protein
MNCRLLVLVYNSGVLVGIRTPNLLIRSEMLYPVELRKQNWSANVRFVLNISKTIYCFYSPFF